MNLAEKLRAHAMEVKTAQNERAIISIIDYVKTNAAAGANIGNTNLLINLDKNRWTCEQAQSAIKELSKEGFKCQVQYAHSYSNNSLNISWE